MKKKITFNKKKTLDENLLASFLIYLLIIFFQLLVLFDFYIV